MKRIFTYVFCVAAACISLPSSAQFLNKLKQKAENKIESAVDKTLAGNQSKNGQNGGGGMNGGSIGQDTNGNTTGGGGGLGQNQAGNGLISASPDVNQNLSDGEASYKNGKYGEARYSIQQAMLGIELEIGNKILKSLPEMISGLNKDVSADKVTSTGSGWTGLSIERVYNDANGKDFKTTIVNSAAMLSAVNMYFTTGGYAQQTAGQQNWKQTKVKGNRAIIEFSQSSGYKLSVPIGQSSLIVYEGVNFTTETEMMAAANAVDIDSIRKMLGEQ